MTGWIGRSALEPDVRLLLRAGLGADAADRQALATVGATAAADLLAGAGMSPALLARVAEAVRAAGIGTVAELPDPVPDPGQSRLLRAWLGAVEGGPDVRRDTEMAAWLGAVCVHLEIRRLSGGG